MKQYHDLLQTILDKGTLKSPARENMPSTISLFGYQYRHNLADGFPLLTTKKVSFKNVVIELLWFLKGDTNIRYLIKNGCNIWNQDAYNYYCKVFDRTVNYPTEKFSFENFIGTISNENNAEFLDKPWFEKGNYILGDCGEQYGKLWRKWKGKPYLDRNGGFLAIPTIDQIQNLIDGLKTSPEGRRHILTAWNPSTLDDMALNACHALVQFNCRKLSQKERTKILWASNCPEHVKEGELLEEANIPKYYLDCSMYQRSADVLLGVPYNTASYALLTSILCKILNMVPGDLVHTFGDVHIYENHLPAVEEQLQREPRQLPSVKFSDDFRNLTWELTDGPVCDLGSFLAELEVSMFELEDYNPHPKLENDTKLSTGMK